MFKKIGCPALIIGAILFCGIMTLVGVVPTCWERGEETPKNATCVFGHGSGLVSATNMPGFQLFTAGDKPAAPSVSSESKQGDVWIGPGGDKYVYFAKGPNNAGGYVLQPRQDTGKHAGAAGGVSFSGIPFGWAIGCLVGVLALVGFIGWGAQKQYESGITAPRPDPFMGFKYVGTIIFLVILGVGAIALVWAATNSGVSLMFAVVGVGSLIIIFGIVCGGLLGWTYSAGTSQYRFADNGRAKGAISAVISIALIVVGLVVLAAIMINFA